MGSTAIEPAPSSLKTLPRGEAQAMTQLNGLFSTFFDNLEAVMFDCDGVLWMGMDPLPGAKDLVIKMRACGKRIFFLTNNSTKTREEFLEKFNKLGFQTTLEEIVGTSFLAALYLKERNFSGKVYVIGTPGITGELDNVGIRYLPIGPDPIPPEMITWSSSAVKIPELDPEVQAVIVGFDHHISFMKIMKAATYLNNPDIIFLATNTDERFPSGEELILPGTGSIVAAVKTAAEREPLVMGKPHAPPFDFIKRSFDINPEKTLMIGDRANTDIFFGKNCGLWTLLVLTGVTSLEEVEQWRASDIESDKNLVPDFYLQGVSNLLSLIDEHDANVRKCL